MKTNFLRNTLYVSLLATGLALTSCKDNAEGTTTETESTQAVDNTGTMSSEPIGDTIVTDNDTVVKTGTENDTKENPTGTQVP